MNYVKSYKQFFLNESSSNNIDDDLCRLVFKDVVNHLRGLPYEIKTDDSKWGDITDFQDVAEEIDDNWLSFNDDNMELILTVNDYNTLPDNIRKLLIESEVIDAGALELYDMLGDDEIVLDALGISSDPKLEITILGIGLDIGWSLHRFSGGYDSPPESEANIDDVQYDTNSITINIRTEFSSIELDLNQSDDVARFDSALTFYSDPDDVLFALDSSLKNSDTFRKKVKLRSKG